MKDLDIMVMFKQETHEKGEILAGKQNDFNLKDDRAQHAPETVLGTTNACKGVVACQENQVLLICREFSALLHVPLHPR